MYIIKNGNIHVGDGTILLGYDLLTDGKFIAKLEKNIDADGCRIIDALGCEVFPGFIDPNCAVGALGMPTRYMDNMESTSPVTPEMNIKYSIDPTELDAQEFYKSGITAVGAAPGHANLMGGQIAVCKTAPQKLSQRIVKECAVLKCSVESEIKSTYGTQNQLPKTKMGIFYLWKETLRAAREDKEKTTAQKLLCNVFDQQTMPVFVAASTKGEIDGILQVTDKERIALTLVDGFQFGESLEQIKDRKVGLILGNISYLSQITKNGMDLSKLKDLVENGNQVAFSGTCSGCSEGREVLLWTAIDVHRGGVDAEEVIKMLTLNPAKMLGVDDRIGTLEVGKDADISVFSAHPITSYDAKVIHSMVNGEVIF